MLKAILVAASVNPTAPTAETEDRCEAIGELAGSIMTARQEGVPLSRMMGIANGNEGIIALVLQAYGQPRFSTNTVRMEAVADFHNQVELICYEQM